MNILKQIPCRPQLSERMKVVDVISSRVYSDSQQIIAQVISLFVRFSYFCYIYSYNHLNASALQGDLADCFYIVESGQVRITMKRSRVCLKKKKKRLLRQKDALWWFLVSNAFLSFFARRKKTRRKRRWISRHAPAASILGSWRLSPTSPELHQPMLWGASSAWVHFDRHLEIQHVNRNLAWNYV